MFTIITLKTGTVVILNISKTISDKFNYEMMTLDSCLFFGGGGGRYI